MKKPTQKQVKNAIAQLLGKNAPEPTCTIKLDDDGLPEEDFDDGFNMEEAESVMISPAKVYCEECDEWILVDLVEFLNIEEDFYGYDLMTFKCPQCGTEQKSNITK